jgi:SAM-dependent methyltransferase
MKSKLIFGRGDYSEMFYASYAERYAEVAHEFLQSEYTETSHPALGSDLDLQKRLRELATGKRGLDAGCGAGARDVYAFFSEGYDMWGVDAVEENIRVAHEWHPEIQERVKVHDLRDPLPFPDGFFDFAMCNSVIQHINSDDVYAMVLPELERVIRPGGVLLLVFKSGKDTISVYDKDFCAQRCFRLFEENRILEALKMRGMRLIEDGGEELGGVMWFIDPKKIRHCATFLSKHKNEKNLFRFAHPATAGE